MRRSTTISISVLILVLAACESSRPVEEPVDTGVLDGAWVTRLTLESHLLGRAGPQERTVAGDIALLRNPSLATEPGLSGSPTHSGTYAARLRPFGFEIRRNHDPPTVVARLGPRDSVEIVLQPNGESPVRMAGVLTGDSITGRWWYAPHRGGSASGRFSMRHR
jgi:hypothetical protein